MAEVSFHVVKKNLFNLAVQINILVVFDIYMSRFY